MEGANFRPRTLEKNEIYPIENEERKNGVSRKKVFCVYKKHIGTRSKINARGMTRANSPKSHFLEYLDIKSLIEVHTSQKCFYGRYK